MSRSIKVDVFGRLLLAVQSESGWTVFYLSEDGKRRKAEDIVVPSFVSDSEIDNYFGDLCHEWASTKFPEVRRLN
jgi:hypothetical protein